MDQGIYQHTRGAYVRVFGVAKYQERDVVVFEDMSGNMMALSSGDFFGVEGVPGDRFHLVRKIEVYGKSLAKMVDEIINERNKEISHACVSSDHSPG